KLTEKPELHSGARNEKGRKISGSTSLENLLGLHCLFSDKGSQFACSVSGSFRRCIKDLSHQTFADVLRIEIQMQVIAVHFTFCEGTVRGALRGNFSDFAFSKHCNHRILER